MANFIWDTSLDVGVEAMNEEHKILIGLMNSLYEKNAAGASKDDLLASADELHAYVLKHFADEEAYMESVGFPGLQAHKQLHGNLLAELQTFFDSFKHGSDTSLSSKFSTFLNFWLATHIRGIDFIYGEHAKDA
jgi:hemerythrin